MEKTACSKGHRGQKVHIEKKIVAVSRRIHPKRTIPMTTRTLRSLAFSTCDLCDAHENDHSGAFRVLPPVFRSFGSDAPFAGPVYTLRCDEDNSRVREAVQSAGEGRVLVVAGGGKTRRALLGGMLARLAAEHGWAGVVVDGAVRDVAELRESRLPIRALALMPMRTEKRGAGEAGITVEIQGVKISTGDWLYADEDGIVVADRPLLGSAEPN
jgi:regulator of ribonuclease activity A